MKSVLEYFEEIMKIPRESGKEEKIAEYLVKFAKKNNLEYKVGKYNTVYMRKNNNSDETIILQAHSDMVCVSTKNYDFDNKGIPFYIDGDYYKSKNTSLGADDGIGVAIILAILQENENMPNIEVIITTQEETTMLGASNFDYSLIKGKTLISLDGIKEADIESSSAGMCSITINKTINYETSNEACYKLSISGLIGGHSGDDIDKNRCNAIKLAVRILNDLNCKNIGYINFGKRDNVIPSEGYVIFSYKELYGKETTIKKVHACMEGGILSNNIQDLDICTIAPNIENCHSINEKVSISSTKRVYEWLKQTLIRYNQYVNKSL